MLRPCLFALVIFVSSCTHYIPEPDDRRVDLTDPGYWQQVRAMTNRELCNEYSADDCLKHWPQMGLALSGGGTKAANYAMGVLAGLNDHGVLNEFDYISSVSGGGYAAYFYYSRLVDFWEGKIGTKELDSIFEDCLPRNYEHFCKKIDENGDRTCDDFQKGLKLCPYLSRSNELGDPFRFQQHIRGYQDVFGNQFDLRSTNLDGIGSAGLPVIAYTGKGLLASPLNAVFNGVFDGAYRPSPSREDYRYGLWRTFGYLPEPCVSPRSCPRQDGLTFDKLEPKSRNLVQTLPFEQREDCANCRVPFWILNAAVDHKPGPFSHSAPLGHPELSNFEMTGIGYYSALYGFGEPTSDQGPERLLELEKAALLHGATNPNRLDMLTAVTSSAAFFAPAQRLYSPWIRPIIRTGLKTLGADWSYTFPGPHYGPTRYQIAKWLPWPLYWSRAWPFRHPNAGHEIEIFDGGQSENLGAWPLIRRGVQHIVIADAAQDTDMRLGDVCRLAKDVLLPKGLHLTFSNTTIPILRTDDWVKNCSSSGINVSLSKLAWPQPVLQGKIDTKVPSDCDRLESQCPFPIHVYILKPALSASLFCPDNLDVSKPYSCISHDDLPPDLPFYSNGLNSIHNSCVKTSKYFNYRKCAEGWAEKAKTINIPKHSRYAKMGIPLEVYAYYLDGGWEYWPQTGTVWQTINSSFSLYGAYRELARWQTSHIEWPILGAPISGMTNNLGKHE